MGFRAHTADMEAWLDAPGASDLTAHVNLTAIRAAAEDAGLSPLGMTDQTYFVTALGLAARLDEGQSVGSIRRRLAARTLVMPGGLGSTMKAIAFGKDVKGEALRALLGRAPHLTGVERGDRYRYNPSFYARRVG